jgi:hypothetical protein
MKFHRDLFDTGNKEAAEMIILCKEQHSTEAHCQSSLNIHLFFQNSFSKPT